MSILEGNGFTRDYLSAEVPGGAAVVQDEVDVERVGTNNQIYIDGSAMVGSEDLYRLWHEGTVAVVPINDDEQIEVQNYLNESENNYDEQQYEYMQAEELPADVSDMGESLQLECSLPTRYVHANELDYIEEDIATEHPEVVEFQIDEVEGLVNRGRRKPPTVVQCEVCGAVVKHPSKIEAHMRTHTGEKPFECEICGAKFTQRTPMLNHVRRHLGQTPYACGYGCGKSFVNNAQKKAHELRHLGTKRSGPPRPHLKPPKRQAWNKSFSKTGVFPRQGEEERTTMVDFAPPEGHIEQPISAAASKRLDEVIESVVSGIPIKKKKIRSMRAPLIVQCQVCGLMLKHASKIKAHIRTHTGDRPYLCVHCFASFNTSGTLAMHIKRKHMSGERPYSCTWDCGRRFVSISTRNEHERVVHAGAKRYECTVSGCHRMFTRRCYLMLHRQREHASMFKPIFDPQEIEKAEKEADMELTAEKQQSIVKDSSLDQQFLVDPATNMLVHVSENGMVLEPVDEQPTFIGEFVEESEEADVNEFFEEETSEVNPLKLYIPSEGFKSDELVPADMRINGGPSNDTSAAAPQEELILEKEVPNVSSALNEDHSVIAAAIDKSGTSKKSFAPKRVVNILKRMLPLRLPRAT